MTENFYMTLPSNASMNEFPSNATSHFTTRLRDRVDLDGLWEVALVEASVPTRWTNLISENYIRIYFPFDRQGFGRPREGNRDEFVPTPSTSTTYERRPVKTYKWMKLKIPSDKLYHHPTELIDALNTTIYTLYSEAVRTTTHTLNNSTKKKYFSYDEETGMITIDVNDEPIQISGQLAMILGIGEGDKKWVAVPRSKTRKFAIDLKRGLHHIFLYSDIVQFVLLGDVSAPLLRVMPLSSTYNDPEQYTHVFTNPHYIPVSRRSIETIQIDLRNDIGDFIPFVSGKSIVKLHFRRRRPL